MQRLVLLLCLLPLSIFATAPVLVEQTWSASKNNSITPNVAYYAIIVNQQNQMPKLKPGAIGRLFLKQFQLKGPNGKNLIPVNNTAGHNMSAFAQGVLNWSGAQLNSYWSRQIFSGGQTPLLSFSSNGKVIAYVSKHINAISYIPVEALYMPVRYPKGTVRVMALFRITMH